MIDRPPYSGWGWNEYLQEDEFNALKEETQEQFRLLREQTELRFNGLQEYWRSRARTWEIDLGITDETI